MNNEKRENKGYKIKPTIYKKAMRRAKKEKNHLARLVEEFVSDYASGIIQNLKKNNKS